MNHRDFIFVVIFGHVAKSKVKTFGLIYLKCMNFVENLRFPIKRVFVLDIIYLRIEIL